MNTTSLNITIQSTIKTQAQHTAEELGLSLNAVIQTLLTQFIRTRQISEEAPEKPTAYFKQLLKQANADVKAGRITTFQDKSEALTFIDTLIEKKSTNAIHNAA